jgi:hypothetical protein
LYQPKFENSSDVVGGVLVSYFKKTTERSKPDPVRILQEAILGVTDLQSLCAALEAVLQIRLWERDGHGQVFACFAEFVIARRPVGLEIRTTPSLKVLRTAMIAGGHYAEWTELLKVVMRNPGRPRNTRVNDESFVPFYTVSTAKTSIDRILLALERQHPEHFARVCRKECRPFAAAVDAGLAQSASARSRVCDVEALKKLGEAHKRHILREVFRAAGHKAQCSLIAEDICPHLGVDLATRWRELGRTGFNPAIGRGG